MHPSILLLAISLIYTILIFILFSIKDKKNTLENKIYMSLLVTVIIGIILDICGIYCHLLLPDTSFIRWFVVKLYLAYLLVFVYLITVYVVLVSYKKEMKLVKEKETNKKVKHIVNFLTFVLIISLVLNFILGYTYYKNGNEVYLFGPNTIYVYGISAIGIISWLYFAIKNRKGISLRKIIPILLFVAFCIPVILLQLSNPQILVVTSLTAFLVNFMYHTIENPDLKQLEEVTRNNEITEQAYIDKSNFIFEMTQEVREPLNYIKNTSKELLDNDRKKEEYQEGLNYIYNASRQLDFVVNDVLNVSSLDVQKVKILNNRYNLDMIYDDLVKRIGMSVNNNVEFRHTIPSKVPYLYGDNIKLKQILYSILMNSVKKTEKGFIEFNIDTIEKYDVCRVIFRITDSGVGIGIDKINEILSTTSELNKDDIVNLEKSEFNIKLCQKIIKSLGGNLLIKSKLGKGTEVILTIDQKIYREKEDKNNNLFNSYSNKRVLVVNQDKKVNEIIKKVFNESDINASYMLYGADAIDRIKSGKKYDYIIIEDDMKEMSGYETLKKLKEISKFNIPCIVVLDSNKENIKKHYLDDGFSDYILTSDLRNELKRIMEKY